MTDLRISPCHETDTRTRYVADGPIRFEAERSAPETELVRGVIIDKMAARYPREWIVAWLSRILGVFVEELGLGVVLGARSAVWITTNDGRLPDILFVRADNLAIVHDDAIYGVPDLVIEVISQNDRPYNLVPLEADYRSIGVPEVLFIDPQQERVRLLRRRGFGAGEVQGVERQVRDGSQAAIGNDDAAYDESILTEGQLDLASVPGFGIDVAWLFADARPSALAVITNLLDEVNRPG